MPPEDGGIQQAMLDAVRDLSTQLGTVRAEIKEDTVELIAAFREDVNKSILSLAKRILNLEIAQEDDRRDRVTRQQAHDTAIADINRQLDDIRSVGRRRLWGIIGAIAVAVIEAITISALVAYWIGVSAR